MGHVVKIDIAEMLRPAPLAEVRPNILIVDDRKENLLATEKVLRNLDAKIFKANSGNEALSLMLRHRFAVILLDVQMPEMDGFEVAMLMQEHESMRGIPIIFVTAISKEEKYANQAAEIGAVDYIFKPINSEILKSKVKVYLDSYVQREQILKLNDDLRQSNEESRRYYSISAQAQKMEALGQLTGGIAHDFNNLLAIIMGNLDCLQEQTLDDSPLRKFIKPSIEAAEHGAELTQRLLAFGRKQSLQPKIVCINDLLLPFSTLVKHTLGERIHTIVSPAKELWHVNIDVNQLQNALLNLAVNARDAMPEGGKLIFETMNTSLDEDYASANNDVMPGNYVMVSVTDTGEGMDEATIEKAFEPFFTTKEVGKGSGLGLSMVYGFVKQSSGHIKISSTQGQGTSIRIYLPKTDGAPSANQPKTTAPIIPAKQQAKLVLVVEDKPSVLAITSAMIQDMGFTVLTAETGDEALAIIEARPDVDLLLTDVMLPGAINGPALAKRAVALHPKLRVLFNSGYAEDVMRQNGILEGGVHLISKPFRKRQLATKIAEVMK